jgi:hypothetical protein
MNYDWNYTFPPPLAAAVLENNLLAVHAVKELPSGNCNSVSCV